MRFKEATRLTGLPIEKVSRSFRNEDVITVLPARLEERRYESLLVATSAALAIVIREAGAVDERWLTRWAPWDVVRVSDGAEALGLPDPDDEYRLIVSVGGMTFHAEARGAEGQRWLREFVVAAQARRGALVRKP